MMMQRQQPKTVEPCAAVMRLKDAAAALMALNQGTATTRSDHVELTGKSGPSSPELSSENSGSATNENSPPVGSSLPLQAKKRPLRDPTMHRLSEKRRRQRIADLLMELREILPASFLEKNRGRIEKTEVIRSTLVYIKHLKSLVERSPETKCTNCATGTINTTTAEPSRSSLMALEPFPTTTIPSRVRSDSFASTCSTLSSTSIPSDESPSTGESSSSSSSSSLIVSPDVLGPDAVTSDPTTASTSLVSTTKTVQAFAMHHRQSVEQRVVSYRKVITIANESGAQMCRMVMPLQPRGHGINHQEGFARSSLCPRLMAGVPLTPPVAPGSAPMTNQRHTSGGQVQFSSPYMTPPSASSSQYRNTSILYPMDSGAESRYSGSQLGPRFSNPFFLSPPQQAQPIRFPLAAQASAPFMAFEPNPPMFLPQQTVVLPNRLITSSSSTPMATVTTFL